MINWSTLDTVLLDMDGTLLDLHFDTHFWQELVPKRYAQLHQLSEAEGHRVMAEKYQNVMGQLEWYCLDYWQKELGLNIVEMKRELSHLIGLRPYVLEFLQALHASEKQVVLITNAHPASLSLKMEKVQLEPYFDRLISSHEYGYPKEHQGFWQALQQDIKLDRQRALFIDDSINILRSSRLFGIAEQLAIVSPDSQKHAVDTKEFDAIETFADLLPIQ